MGPVLLLLLFGLAVASEVRSVTGDGRASGAVTICTCDVSPGICDLNCCCDPDCADPTNVFSSCLPGSVSVHSQVCLYSWLVFRSNTPYSTALIPSSSPRAPELFCVLPGDASLNYFVTPQSVDGTNFSQLAESPPAFSFSPGSRSPPTFPNFYKAGDPILTISPSDAVGVLVQPAPVGAQNLCSDSNPTRFLHSTTTSCQREIPNVTASCLTDPRLSALHYYQNISVLGVPKDVINRTGLNVDVTGPVPDSPTLRGDRCDNVVSQVLYTVLFNGTRGVTNVSVRFVLVSMSRARLQQDFTVTYKSVSAPAAGLLQSRSGNPGYLVGFPVLADNGFLSLPRPQGDGSCSRTPVQFGTNALSGCSLRGEPSESCEDLRSRAYHVLQGELAPGSLGAFGNANILQSQDWIPVIYQNCTNQAVGDCTTGCLLPVFLHMQILWAEVGLQSNPQAQIQGARFTFGCRSVSCSDATILQSEASFADITRRGPPPRSQAAITAREPLDFFYPFRTSGSSGTCRGPGLAVVLWTLMWWV